MFGRRRRHRPELSEELAAVAHGLGQVRPHRDDRDLHDHWQDTVSMVAHQLGRCGLDARLLAEFERRVRST